MRCLIVGGGIAGPAAALALHARGLEPVLLEAHDGSSGEVGSYFTVSPNGLAALDQVGCLDAVVAAGFATRRNLLLGATGRRLGETGLGSPLRGGVVAVTMRRPALAALLVDEVRRRGIELRLGCRVREVVDDRSVALADGTVVMSDLLIGADGVHSLVRRWIDPAAPSGRYVGLTNFGGITRRTPLAARLEPEAWTMVFGRRAFFGAHPTPEGDVVWFVNAPRAQISADERATTTDAAWLAWLGRLAEPDAGPFHELLSTGVLELAGDNTFDLRHVPQWRRGRAVIVGDAAHAPAPSSGQGASLALEDAVVLAAALADAATPEAGLADYESARRSRVEKVVAVGARSSSSKTAGPVGRIVQDAVLRLVFRSLVTERSQAWLFDHRVRLRPDPAG